MSGHWSRGTQPNGATHPTYAAGQFPYDTQVPVARRTTINKAAAPIVIPSPDAPPSDNAGPSLG